MTSYQPRTDDMAFILSQVLRAPRELQALPPFAEVDPDLMRQILDQAGKFVGEVVAPLNRGGDETGCRFDNGHVTTPPGFRDAYQAFWQAGWPALAAAPGLLHGAYECIKHHGSDELKARYLTKIATGEWLATMCLTEPQAGSDLGLVRTKAIPQPDGSFLLSGTKIFISGGEHDLSDNIVHLVLARLPNSKPGPKGLSLFIVPKFMPDGSRSAVHCERIEEKMGLHGSATCVMRFDEARSWIVGEPGRGLNAMFVMMNAARLHVALQGIGLLDVAWQKADAHSRERRQMRPPGHGKSAAQADLIADHPAMRRILDTQRAWIDGGRVLAYRTAVELDMVKHHPDAARREAAQRWCSLVTPVIKAAFTQQAFYGGSECLQEFGDHGYVREWGVEQNVRDARVAMIYERTNEIQAIDLLVRKELPDGGKMFFDWLNTLRTNLDPGQAPDARVLDHLAALEVQTRQLVAVAAHDMTLAHWVADDFLRAVALTLLDWAWLQIGQQAPFTAVQSWAGPAQALQRWVMPELGMRLGIIDTALTGL